MLAAVAVTIRIALIGVFLLAGVTKFRNRAEFEQVLTGLGFPPAMRSAVSWLLPALEVAVAVLLAVPGVAAPSALAAIGLLGVLTVGIAVALKRDVQASCGCFGPFSRGALTRKTLARNVLFLAGATLVYWSAADHARLDLRMSVWQGLGIAAGIVFAVVLAALIWLVTNLMRQHGRLLDRIEELEAATGLASRSAPAVGLAAGSRAPDFELQAPDGTPISLVSLRTPGLPLLVAFMSTTCAPCMAFAPELVDLAERHADAATVAILVTGTPNDLGPHDELATFGHTALDPDRAVAARYASPGTPSAVLVDADGLVAAPMAIGPEEIRSLFRSVLGPRVTRDQHVQVVSHGP